MEDSREDLFGEHSYAKAWKDDGGPYGSESAMDMTPVANADDIIVNVTQLDKNHDTFESLLFELLKSHSVTSSVDTVITPDSLATLSQDQIKDIEASSPAYYETIQHVLKKKNNVEFTPSPMSVDSMGLVSDISNHTVSIGSTANQSSLTNSTTSNASSSSGKVSLDFIKSPPPLPELSGNPIVAVSSPGAKSPSISIKISPDQMKSLQSQLSDMFKQQNLQLPDDLSAEQKQMLLNSLIAQQLNATLQQWLPGSSTASATSSSTQPRTQHNITTVASTTQTGGGVASTSSTATTKVSSSGQSSRTSTATEKTSKGDEPTKKKKDSDSKRPPTAFNLFFSEMYPIVQEQQPNISFSDASKMVSGLWSGLGQDGKKKYYDKCEQIRNDFNNRSKQEAPSPAQRPTDDHVGGTPVSTRHNSSSEEAIIKSPTVKNTSGKKSKVTREKEEGMCLHEGCYNMAVPDDSRGTKYCSNECTVNHSKIMFHAWVSQRRVKTV